MICQLLAIAACSAQPRIVGPAAVRPGDIAVLVAVAGDELQVCELSGEKPKTDRIEAPYKWELVNSDKQFLTQQHERGPAIGFSTGDAGTYTFLFVCTDGARILTAKHVLTVGDKPPPSPTPNPTPGPDPSRFGITEQARQWMGEVPAAERPRALTFAAACKRIASSDTVRSPQEMIDEMIAAANEMGPAFTAFRSKLRTFMEDLIGRKMLRSSKDVAAFLLELAAGVE